jgi:hypothetical protein
VGTTVVNADDGRRVVAEHLALQAVACRHMGSPFYGRLFEHLQADADAGGPTWDLLGPYAAEPFEQAYRLRLLGGVHKVVLAGSAPDLAAHFPSTDGDGDADAAWPVLRELLRDPPDVVLAAMTRPPQTNEVGRSAALVPGFLLVAQESGLPLRLLEIGTSAALNLRVDRYRYEAGNARWGDPASAVRFVDLWTGARPPLDVPGVITSRRGCDRDPIDATDPDAALTLLSYVWPGQTERFELLRAALDVARAMPVAVDRADAETWLPEQLAEPVPATATVVFHSIMWGYLTGAAQERVRDALHRAGARSTVDAPLAWLRLEPSPEVFPVELRLTRWPGGQERLVATAGYHGGEVRMLPM